MKLICHLMYLDKFIPPYIKFIEENLDPSQHIFLIYGDDPQLAMFPTPKRDNVVLLWQRFPNVLSRDLYVCWKIAKAYKIFIHGLWEHRLNRLLCFVFWKLKDCHYAIWGADLYHYIEGDKSSPWYNKKEKYRRFIIKRFGFFIPVVYEEYDLAVEWYGATGKMLEPFMYVHFYEPYQNLPLKPQGEIINIQVGNSATQSNHHKEAFHLLAKHPIEKLRIYAPISYGNEDYAREVKQLGKELFGENFKPLESYMPFKEYEAFLQSIDIAIFNQWEQQAMGNIFVLIALGKKVYINAGASHYEFLKQKGFRIFDLASFSLDPISEEDALHNKNLVLELYSKEKQIANQKSFFA